MKHFKLLVILMLVSAVYASAQNKNALRVGLGFNVYQGYPEGTGLQVGPSLFAEYGRVINPYFSVAINLHTDFNQYGSHHNLQSIGASVRGFVTPLPKYFRWIKLGVGVTYEYRKYISGSNNYYGDSGSHKYWQNTDHYWGIDFPVRGYFIDNDRFEFYAFYEFKTIIDNGKHFWSHSNGGLSFGVKF